MHAGGDHAIVLGHTRTIPQNCQRPRMRGTMACMHVSVIATVYNERAGIERLLESLVGQTRRPDGAILCDGGSQAGTAEAIRAYAARHPERLAGLLAATEWIRQCRRAGLYTYGRAIYERGGFDFGTLSAEAQVEVEEDYQVCVRRS